MNEETHEEYLARMQEHLIERRRLRKLRISAWALLAAELMDELPKHERDTRITEIIARLEAGER